MPGGIKVKKQSNNADILVQIKEHWRIVLRRKWVVLLAGTILSTAAVVSIVSMPNWYSASITVSVDPQKMPDRYVSSSVTIDQLRFDTLSEQVLNTPKLLQIINELKLYPESRSRMTQQELVDYMRQNISIQIKQGGDRNPSAFTIKFTDKNRQMVAKVATRLADSFIEWDLATREREAAGASKFLASQLEDARSGLEAQEAKVNSFRRQHLGELPEQAGANSAALSRLQVALQANIDNLNRLEQEKILLADGNTTPPPQKSAPIERVRLEEQEHKLSEQLADLRSRYSDEYPDVVQTGDRLMEVRQQLAKLPPDSTDVLEKRESVSASNKNRNSSRLLVTNNEIARLQAEQQDILAKIKEYQAKVDAAPLREQELNELGRDYRSSTVRYQSVLDKTLTADMAEQMERAQEVERFSILDPAQIPDKPFKPHRLRWIILGAPGCFLLAALLAIFFETVVRGKIGTERALQELLPESISVVGRIPEMETSSATRRERQLAIVAISGSLICCLIMSLFLIRMHTSA
jgi:polysaccharide chain length determinant protein (PEP-CTERM system associated)